MHKTRLLTRMSNFVTRKQRLHSDMEKAHSVIFGQFSDQLQHKLKNSQKWESISSAHKVLDPLVLIKMIVYKYKEDHYLPLSVHNERSAFYTYNQGNLGLNDYREKFNNMVEIDTSY